MKLYHFTSQLHLWGCQRVGLQLGRIPTFDEEENFLLTGIPSQWLTSNSSFDQAWARHSSLSYNRTDFRITIHIPKSAREQLYSWNEHGQRFTDDMMFKILNSKGHPEEWSVFRGTVKPAWFRAIDRNENMILLNTEACINFRLSLRKKYPKIFGQIERSMYEETI